MSQPLIDQQFAIERTPLEIVIEKFYILLNYAFILAIVLAPIVLLTTWYKVKNKKQIGKIHLTLILIEGILFTIYLLSLLKTLLFPLI